MERFLISKSQPLKKQDTKKAPILPLQEAKENQEKKGDQRPKKSENLSVDNDTQATRISASIALSSSTVKSTIAANQIFAEEKQKRVLGEKNLNQDPQPSKNIKMQPKRISKLGGLGDFNKKVYTLEDCFKENKNPKEKPQKNTDIKQIVSLQGEDKYRNKLFKYFKAENKEIGKEINQPQKIPTFTFLKKRTPAPKKFNFQEDYEIGAQLGEGASAIVRLITRKSDGKKFALKSFKKESKFPTAAQEAAILNIINCPGAIKLERTFKSDTKVHQPYKLTLLEVAFDFRVF